VDRRLEWTQVKCPYRHSEREREEEGGFPFVRSFVRAIFKNTYNVTESLNTDYLSSLAMWRSFIEHVGKALSYNHVP
jgi:hypothetical protein